MTTSQFSLPCCYLMELRSIWGASASGYFTELQNTGFRLGLSGQTAGQIVILSEDGRELVN